MVCAEHLSVDCDIAAEIMLRRGQIMPHVSDVAELRQIVADARAKRSLIAPPECKGLEDQRLRLCEIALIELVFGQGFEIERNIGVVIARAVDRERLPQDAV